jgi:hypothetical protein
MTKERGWTTQLTRDAIESVLGPVSESLAAQLLATGATESELRLAHAWVVNDETLINDMRPFPTGRVAELIEILEPFEAPQVQDD